MYICVYACMRACICVCVHMYVHVYVICMYVFPAICNVARIAVTDTATDVLVNVSIVSSASL